MHTNHLYRTSLLIATLLTLGVTTGCPDDTSPPQQEDMSVTTRDMAPDASVDEEDLIAMVEDLGQDAAPDLSDADMPPPVVEKSIPPGCNPVAFEHHCMFPYPSNVFLKDGANTPSGHEVELTDAARITNTRGDKFDFLKFHPADGFSHHQPIVASFAEEIDPSNLVFHTDDITKSLDVATSPTLLINADTGELVPHWAEVDRLADDPVEQVLFLRVLKNLDFQTRYVVVIQGIQNAEGAPIARPEGFAQLMSGDVTTYPEIAPLKERYDADIFPLLSTLGVDSDSVQLAWDFTTQSEEMITRDLITMRDDLMSKLEQTPPAVTVTAVKEDFSEQIGLRVEGTITVPFYLEEDKLLARLHRNAEGQVEANGTIEVPFTLQVPVSAIPENGGFEPARMMQYGHGFFGSREEINYSFMRNYSNERRYVTASVDWRGMSEDELTELPGKLLSEIDESFLIIDGVHQGVINFIALSHALKTTMTEVPELSRFNKLLYDPEHLYYYGISQGQILGAAFLAMSPHVEKAVLSVGGAPFSFMMSRSNNFESFVALLRSNFKDDRSLQQFITLCQHTFDRIDPSTYSAHLLNDRMDGGPADRKILMHLGYWDHSVPILSGLIYARNAGIDVLLPSTQMPYGLAGVEGPVTDGSALTLFDFNTPDPPGFYAQLPTNAQRDHVKDVVNVHEAIRRQAVTQEQIEAFLQVDGIITHTCDGACDPD